MTARKNCTIAIAVLIVAAGIGLWRQLILPQGPPTWDGAEHSLYGLGIFSAIESGEVNAFIRVTASQNLWPFLHSWLLGVAFLIAGPSFTAARAVSLLLWAATVLATAAMTRRIIRNGHPGNASGKMDGLPDYGKDGECGPDDFAGLIAVVLCISSPMMMLYAAQPMLEMPGALLTMLTLMAAAGAGPRSKHLTGFLLLVTLFTKYVYAQLLVAALVMDLLIGLIGAARTGTERRQRIVRQLADALCVFGPAALGGVLWFLRPNARAGYMAAVHNPAAPGYSVLSPVNLIIYPVLLLAYYYATPLLAVPAILPVFRRIRGNRMFRVGLIYATMSLLMLTVYWYKLTRAVFTVAPVLFALGAAGAAIWFQRCRSTGWKRAGAVLLLVHLQAAFIPGILVRHHPAMHQEAAHMLNFEKDLTPVLENAARAVDGPGPVGIVGDFHTVNPPLVRWVFLTAAKNRPLQAFSLLNWSRPVAAIELADLIEGAAVPQALVIRVVPGSRFDTQDYRDHYGWMTANLHIDTARVTPAGQFAWNDDVRFELWKKNR